MQSSEASKMFIACMLSPFTCVFVTPVDRSPLGSFVHGIPQARILQWVAVSFSRGSSLPRDQACVSHVSHIGRWVLYY